MVTKMRCRRVSASLGARRCSERLYVLMRPAPFIFEVWTASHSWQEDVQNHYAAFLQACKFPAQAGLPVKEPSWVASERIEITGAQL